jgi:thiol-disulfide isomerase/thioredoxin
MKLIAVMLLACAAWAQAPESATATLQFPNDPQQQRAEQEELSRVVQEANGSNVDLIRALERHLAKYPQSAQRAVIENTILKSAIEANDRARILSYGERIIGGNPQFSDLQTMDRVTRVLLDTDDPEPAKRALILARRYEAAVEEMRPKWAENHMSQALWNEEVNKGSARSQVLAARATGNAGDVVTALSIALSAWEAWPSSESALEVARWASRLAKNEQALEFYANAFTIDDSRTTAADRARDRERMSELYRKTHDSEAGLGDLILAAFDRMAALRNKYAADLQKKDPNAGQQEVMAYTLKAAVGNESLALASLKGKTVVMDFWATWCAPCRAQYPLIENVKKRYGPEANVAFISVDADDDPAAVAPFLKEMQWDGPVFLESGLSRALTIASIPTILVIDPAGKVSSRMTGFIPERFEDMLKERIEEARDAGKAQ